MTLRRFVYHTLNDLLSRVGLEIRPLSADLDARLVDAADLAVVFDAFHEMLQPWFDSQTVFDIRERRNIRPDIEEFYSLYLDSPFRQTGGGSRFNNQLLLFLIARIGRPDLIIDSGTFTGASAWAFAMGSSQTEVLSFDIDLSKLKYRAPGVKYIQSDWRSYSFDRPLNENTIIYFDDHVNQVRRLLEATSLGIPTIVFDDDFWLGSFAPMANGGASLPKIAFAVDPHTRSKSHIAWTDRNRNYSMPLPKEDLQRAYDEIAEYTRMPNTGLLTGIYQTPYTIVRTRKPKILHR